MNDAAQESASVAVVIPTRSRPQKLRRCLDSLSAARERLLFHVYVCDSSPSDSDRMAVRKVCERHDWVSLSTHDGANIAAGRNACVQIAREDILVNVDDDLELEPEAIERLVARYNACSGPCVVAGSVSWDGTWTTPIKIRLIGYGRPSLDGEQPDFLLGAFFAYPRSCGLAWPWNERIDTSVDIFMGALWRSHRVQLLFASDARALHPALPASHDPSRMADAVRDQRWHLYALLFDALIANPSVRRALSYEVLGFIASAKPYLSRPRWVIPFLRSWIEGHVRLIADRRYLRALVKKELFSDGP